MAGILGDNLLDFQLAGTGQVVASFFEKQVAHGVLQAPAVVDLDVPELAVDRPVGGLKGLGPGTIAVKIDLVAVTKRMPVGLSYRGEDECGGDGAGGQQASHGHPFQQVVRTGGKWSSGQ